MTYYHKIGDALDLSGEVTVTDAGALVTDMTGWTATSQMRKLDGTLIATLEVTWLNAAQRLVRVRYANTSWWPAGPAMFDIRFVSPSGDAMSTSTEQVVLFQGATYA